MSVKSRSYGMTQATTPILVAVAASLVLIVGSHDAAAKGCIKGAAVGAVAGHVAGHHAVLGAVAGCAVGHHLAKKQQQQLRQQRQSTQPAQQAPAPDSSTITS